jgi:DNA-binding HxlR family transcriptional regulator
LEAPEASASTNGEVRAGSRILSLFANPLSARILRGHSDGPLRLSVLHEQIGWTPHTTLRAAVNNLCGVGALEKGASEDSRSSAVTALTPAGEEMIMVADALERWLASCPRGPISPYSDEAKGAVKALAGGWNSTLMRALAGRPSTLTGLDKLIPDISYPSLERRLASMRATGQIEAVEAEDRGTPYIVTEWSRRAVAPLAVAGRCERRHLATATAPITDIEVEASFMLVLPLAPLPVTANGTCMLAVQTETDESQERGRDLAGIVVQVKRGEVVTSVTEVNQSPPTWALGTAETWLDAVIDGRFGELRFGGAKPQLAADLVNGLHFALFGERDR